MFFHSNQHGSYNSKKDVWEGGQTHFLELKEAQFFRRNPSHFTQHNIFHTPSTEIYGTPSHTVSNKKLLKLLHELRATL